MTLRELFKTISSCMARFFVLISALIACLFLHGCSLTLEVRGTIGDSRESFGGAATGYADGSGTLTIQSVERGTVCAGDFVYVTRRQGEGTLQCDDGRTGSFTFVSTGHRGTGSGKIGGEEFIFTFGS